MDLTFSMATEKDIVFINEVYHENIESLHGAYRTEEDWKPLLEKPEHTYYIVPAEKVVAWFRTDVEDGGFWLGMLQVKPMYHRQGIGKYILSVAEALAKTAGYQRIGIHTTEDNLAARALYLSAGYAVAVFELWPQAVTGIFGTSDALYQEFAVKTFRIYLSLTTITCVAKMTTIFFQAIGIPVYAIVVSLVRDILCFTPLALLLPVLLEKAEPGSGINGILYAAPISDIIALAVILALTIPFFRKIKKQEEKE